MLESIASFDREKLNTYRITVHGIKGASYDINAQEYGKLAEDLENAANSEDYEYIEKHNPIFIKSAGEFIQDINKVLAAIAAENPKPKRDKPEEKLLHKLCKACESYSMDAIDEAIAELDKFHYESDDGLMERLHKHIDLMQFKQIVALLTENTIEEEQ